MSCNKLSLLEARWITHKTHSEDGNELVEDSLFMGKASECIGKEKYKDILQRFSVAVSDNHINCGIDDFFKDIITSSENKKIEEDLFCLGVSCLQLFVQNNWTGPADPFNILDCINDLTADQKMHFKTHVNTALQLDGQLIYPLTKQPELLFLASSILRNYLSFSTLPTAEWWWLRCLSIHQQILDAKSATIKQSVMSLIDSLLQKPFLHDGELSLLFFLEAGYIYYDMYEHKLASEMFDKAREASQLTVEHTGVLGKRTKFQQVPKSQLILHVSKPHSDACSVPVTIKTMLPKSINLSDDVVLDAVESTEPQPTPYSPSSLDALLILAMMENHRRSQADHTLVQEEISAYIQYLISQPCLWVVQFVALFRRCRLERTSSRRVDRAMMQMEELKHCYSHISPDATKRLMYIYATRMPTWWMVECELASLLMSIGAAGSALDIYERLDLWDEAIVCCQQLGKTHRAESMIRERLAVKETANLYCFLGDVTGCIEHYEKAWELSNQRSTKAQRCMGYLHLNKQQYNKSLECFEKSLSLNSLQIPVWFTYGCCAMSAAKFDLAIKAFHQCVAIDYDNFEAWANLATCHVKLNQKEKAFRILQDAIKCSYDNWRLWENCLVIGTDCGEFQSVINSYHRLLDLKEKWTDIQVLSILVRAVIEDIPDASNQPSSRLTKKVLELFGRITTKITNDADIWRLYAELSAAQPDTPDNRLKTLHLLQKCHRCMCQSKDWEKDLEKCFKISNLSVQLAMAYMKACDPSNDTQTLQHLSSAKMMLNNTIVKIKTQHTNPATAELRPELDESCSTLNSQLQAIIDKMTELKTS